MKKEVTRNEELENWWRQRSVSEKMRIGAKLKGMPVMSPAEASRYWNNESEKSQKLIMDHCIDEHNQHQKEYRRGHTMSY